MMNKEKIMKGVLYGGIEKQEYNSIMPILKDKNRRMLKISAILASIIMLILFILSFIVPSLEKNKILYLVFVCIMLLFFGLSFLPMKTNKSMLFICYGFLLSVFAFAIILGTFLGPKYPATSFCVLIFALPLLFVGKPYRISILMVLSIIGFVICSSIAKEQSIASLDRVNSLSFLFLAIIVNYYFNKTKIRDVLNQTFVERERDTDSLTGLLTKHAAKREISEFISTGHNTGTMLVIDIDNFKSVNDNMGHTFGDTVIRTMGKCIQDTFRQSDILGRFGGDEFFLFIKGIDDVEIIKTKVEVLVSKINESFKSKDNLYCVTGSIGICIYPKNGTSYDELFNKADEALYESKKLGKNCYSFYFDKESI